METKKKFLERVKQAVSKHGSAVVIFNSKDGYNCRKRKITKDSCFVSYYSLRDERWTKYGTCCFVANLRKPKLDTIVKKLLKHDRGFLHPQYMKCGVGKNRKTYYRK